MFELENILTYANANIQIIGIFIAIIGGLVATKLLNAKIEKDTLKEKLDKIKKEIEFNETKRLGKEHRVYLKKKEDYMNYIYDKIIEKDFNICDYEDYGLTEEQRLNIIDEIKEIMLRAAEIFKEKHKKSDVENILKQNHIQENTIEHTIYDYVGYETGTSSNNSGPFGLNIPNLSDIRMDSRFSSLQENLEERDLNNRIDELGELIKWKVIEKEDIESKLTAISNNLNVKNDVLLFILITMFAIYSIMTFIISMIVMLCYVYNLFRKIVKD